MKVKHIQLSLLVLWVIIFSNLLFGNENKIISIDVSYEDKQTYPYCMGIGKDIDVDKPGLTIEAMKNIENKLNVKFNFKRESGTRGQKKLQYNKTDMLLFASYKKERESLGVYPKKDNGEIDTDKRAMNLSYMLYTLKDSKLDWDGKKFINLTGKIGATKGYSIVEFLKANKVDVSENPSNLGDPKKLLIGRIEGFANQESKIDPYLKENPTLAKKIKKIEIPLKTKPYYILFSKQFYNTHTELSHKIWDELKQMDTMSKFTHIKDKY
jgi:polar amino acid transport system substrate-binding protein